MESVDTSLVTAAVVFAAFQGVITYLIWKSDLGDREQKIAQTKLLWFLPVIGGLLVLAVYWGMHDEGGSSRE